MEKSLKHLHGTFMKRNGISQGKLHQVSKQKQSNRDVERKQISFHNVYSFLIPFFACGLFFFLQAIDKKTYIGDKFFAPGDYDYIFEVDDDNEETKSIPFNEGDNPLEAAEKYCVREGNEEI